MSLPFQTFLGPLSTLCRSATAVSSDHIPAMESIYQTFRKQVHTRLIRPIFESVSPVHETALGGAIGVFIGLTPTVGIQMALVLMVWLGFKYLLNQRFDLIVGTALVWISNPLTMFFLYFVFFKTGYIVLVLSGLQPEPLKLSYTAFSRKLTLILNASQDNSLDIIINGTRFLLIDLGWPMLIGSLFYALPLSIFAYVCLSRILPVHRKRKARKLGISYDVWRTKYERA